MKFTCNQQTLAKALNIVTKAVSSRTTMPVLKGILINAEENGKLVLTASDLDICIRHEMDANVEEPGAAVIFSKLFNDIIRKLPNEEIVFYDDSDYSVTIKTGFSEFKVVSLSIDEFPKIGKNEEESGKIIFDRNIFREMIRKTSFAASIEESKGVLTGILTETDEEETRMVALDGFRLALVREPMKSDDARKFIISSRVMNEISRIISESGDESDVVMNLGEKKAVFSIGSTDVVLRLMEGEYIKYNDIIPSENTTRVVTGKEILLESIERASLLAKEGKNNLIKMSLKNDLMIITSRSEEGNVREEIIMDKTGNDLDIGFNSKYIIDVLKVIDDEEISLNFRSGVSPCVIKPVEGDSYEYLVLPVRIPSM